MEDWTEDEDTTRYEPRRSVRSEKGLREIENLLLLEQRIALLERSTARMLAYVRRALQRPPVAASRRRC